jgi:hypothetical protein
MSSSKDYEGELVTFGGFPVGIKLTEDKKKKKV